MAFPVLAIAATGAMAWVKRSLLAYSAAKIWEEYGDRVTEYIRDTAVGKAWLTQAANYKLQQAGINIAFVDLFDEKEVKRTMKDYARNELNHRLEVAGISGLYLNDLFDPETLKNDIDRFAAARINDKLGTTFERFNTLKQDDVMLELGRMMAQRINSEAGTAFTNIFPVKQFREELGEGVALQLASVGAASLTTSKKAARIRDIVEAGMQGYRPPANPQSTTTAAQKAANRLRQAKYRSTHVYLAIPKADYYGTTT